MKIRYAAFTKKGKLLAQRLQQKFGGEIRQDGVPLGEWAAEGFAGSDALVFVGAVGIAVRTVVPFVKAKTQDPAVVVIDECAHFSVPILSGHLGGANDLARQIAAFLDAVPVITTATDANGVFAVDEWARRQGCIVLSPEKIREVSSKVLAGKTIKICSDWAISGNPPSGVSVETSGRPDVRVTLENRAENTLLLIPRITVLGVGCRKNIPEEALEEAFAHFLAQASVWEQAICMVASIDLKQREPGLLEFCRRHGWPAKFYPAQFLADVPGEFSGSRFVKSVTGVDNVCERSAVLASGGTLYRKKWAENGVTMALAVKPFFPDWRWQL